MENYNDEIRKAAEKITKKLQELNGNMIGKCYACSELTSDWIVIFPENGSDGLGFGVTKNKDGNDKMRIAYIPVCTKHDIEDEEIRQKIASRLKVRTLAYRN